jgi:site-specific DNA-methyltransferase (adenine-specific)
MARKSKPRPPRERCPVCRRPIVQPRRGRRRRYCSNACRQTAHRRRRDGQQTRHLVRLVEADARQFLPTLPDQSVDLIVTDPPYHFERGGTYFRDWFDELDDDEWPAIFAELHRVLERNAHAYVFCDPRTLPIFNAAAHAAGFRVRDPLVWNKGSIGLGACWRPQYEFIAWYEKGRRPGNRNNRPNLLTAPRVARGYPTEKPVPLLTELIAQASRAGGLVLDPFCGSGNVGKAARDLRRRAVLCDVSSRVAAARLRLAIERPPVTRRDEMTKEQQR